MQGIMLLLRTPLSTTLLYNLCYALFPSKQNSDMPDIEKEVKRLFRMDNEAIDLKWEVVIEEEKPDDPGNAEKQVGLILAEPNI